MNNMKLDTLKKYFLRNEPKSALLHAIPGKGLMPKGFGNVIPKPIPVFLFWILVYPPCPPHPLHLGKQSIHHLTWRTAHDCRRQ